MKTRIRHLIEVQTQAAGPYHLAHAFLAEEKARAVAEALAGAGAFAGVRLLRVEEAIAWTWKQEEGKGDA